MKGATLKSYCRRFKIPIKDQEKWYILDRIPGYKISNYGRLMDDNENIIKPKIDDQIWYDVTVDLIKYRIAIIYEMIRLKYPKYRNYYLKEIEYYDKNNLNVSMDNIRGYFSKYSMISDKWKPIPEMNGYYVNDIGEVVRFGDNKLIDTIIIDGDIILCIPKEKAPTRGINISKIIKQIF